MELQWPLILFTTFIAWSAGVFGAQGLLIVRGEKLKSHLPLLVTSLVIMGIGGVAVFMHLEHWERIFNGFGHITSGITQELIGIVAMVVVMVLAFAQLRRRADGTIARWCGIAALVVAVALVCAMGHSYMMPSRPAWDSVLQICSLLGAGCIMGPATAAVVMAACGDDAALLWRATFIGAIVNLVVTVAYLFAMAAAQGAYTSIGYYYDPTHLARGMIDFENATGLLAGGRAPLVALVVVFCIVPVVMAFLLKGKDGKAKDAEDGKGQGALARAFSGTRWGWFGIVMTLSAFAGALILRVVFYELGHTVYIFF